MNELKELLKAARKAAEGGNKDIAEALESYYAALGEPVELTERERKLYDLLMQDKNLKEAAEEMGMHPVNVRKLSQKINRAFGVENSRAALLQFMRLE